jgi:hypothetical protein
MKQNSHPRPTRARRATRDDPLWPRACHEAAHAVIAALLGVLGDNSRITIEEEGLLEGSVEFSKDGNNDAWKKWGVRYSRTAIRAFYAGPAASIKLEPCLDVFEEGEGCEFDMCWAKDVCSWIGDPAYTTYEPDKNLVFETRNWKQAVALVEENWPTITSVADELIKQKTMRGHEVKALLK